MKVTAEGPGVSSSRPFTNQLWMLEGLQEREERCEVRVCPALNVIGAKNNNVVELQVTNTSDQWRSIGKRVKIATAHQDFVEVGEDDGCSQTVNSISDIDVVKFLCDRKKLQHLPEPQYKQVEQLVTEYKDVFTISSESMGRANNSLFDMDIQNMSPVAIPIRRIPLHKEHIAKELIDRYLELGLIEEIDSPFRAAMVLVKKKSVGDTVTDQYRLAVDYRKLNEQIPDSGWPAPSVEHCLDAAVGSVYMSKLDFNNGYYQIPCSEAAKYALAFSPGIGFGQYTLNALKCCLFQTKVNYLGHIVENGRNS